MNWITKILKAGEKIKTAFHKRATKEDIANSDWTSCCSCLLYTSPSPRDGLLSRMPSSA